MEVHQVVVVVHDYQYQMHIGQVMEQVQIVVHGVVMIDIMRVEVINVKQYYGCTMYTVMIARIKRTL